MRSLWNLISLPLFQRRDEPADPFSAEEWDRVVRAAAIDKIEQVLADSYALLAEHTPRRPADSHELAHVRRIRSVLTVLAEDLGRCGSAARPEQRDWIDSELLPAVLRAETEIGRAFADLS